MNFNVQKALLLSTKRMFSYISEDVAVDFAVDVAIAVTVTVTVT